MRKALAVFFLITVSACNVFAWGREVTPLCIRNENRGRSEGAFRLARVGRDRFGG
jgi:hypothetical protein